MPSPMPMDFNPSNPLIREPDTGLVLPPWAPPQVRQQMMGMPAAQKQHIMQQQLATVRGKLGLSPSTMPTEAQYKQWLQMEFNQMKQMMSSGGHPGGHSHGGKPCGGHGGHGHDHGHSHEAHHQPQPHSHGGHSHGGKPCGGHGGGQPAGGHSHAYSPLADMDGLLQSTHPLAIPEKIDTSTSDVDEESGLVFPKFVPAAERQQILSMSVQRRKALRRHQVISIRASEGSLKGTCASPTPEDLAEPTPEQTKQWVMREWTKINLTKTKARAALKGQWGYGRRPDGNLSAYEFKDVDGKLVFYEETSSGTSLMGELKSVEDSAVPPDSKFDAAWGVALNDKKGLMWFRVIDGATIESLFVAEGAASKGFKATARRAWAGLAGAPETAEVMLSDDLTADDETGLVMPPWAPSAARAQLLALSLEEKKKVKAMQDQTIRTSLNLAADAPITKALTLEWMRKGYKELMEEQAAFGKLTPAEREAFARQKYLEQQRLVAGGQGRAASPAGTNSSSPAPQRQAEAPQTTAPEAAQSAEEADIQAQLAVINRLVMQNMQGESEENNDAPRKESSGKPMEPALD
ncbi:hypothetical protein DIPPA_28167 [Diplonema papillatum]|nr:hypothetical protein DIPPA_28167 [Diplonema papillatum]